MKDKVAILGECMLELSQSSSVIEQMSKPMLLSYGGDTLNTAVYLARLGIEVEYITALGDDSMSEWMINCWRSEGVGCASVARYANSSPGLYMIETDDTGERSFLYWRDNSPVRRLLDSDTKAQDLQNTLSNYQIFYLSGISLALYDDSSRARLFNVIKRYRSDGGSVIFDGNYRPRLWPDINLAKKAYERMYQLTDIALPTVEDEKMLFNDSNYEDIKSRLISCGVKEIVLKMGAEGCVVSNGAEDITVATTPVKVIDSTSAGDSFNAAYLAAKINGADYYHCASSGNALAALVIQHRGAIIPKELMPDV
ncbi:sugar kinase [Agarilytica rhodophyticola]|uniref:sugar kinase n=1 Tax=Agarilytica rhodophyticola TaxID=1737490 RepID=UPI000B342FAC|nr:sugar kinase [Agarilytica rhodophyticola]